MSSRPSSTSRVTSIRLSHDDFAYVHRLASERGVTFNRIFAQLIEGERQREHLTEP